MKHLNSRRNRFADATCLAAILCPILSLSLLAEPQLSSWYTERSGSYARIYTSTATESTGTASTTWSRGQGVQTLPVYAGVHEINHSNDWVYIHTSGLGFHVMGPWYLNEAKTQDFPNYPGNTASIYRIPRQPTAFDGTQTTGAGAIGYSVDGIALFDATDTFSYINSSGTDGSPVGGGSRGDGVWNRDAYINEGVTFDAANAHQAGAQHHYHANAPALRHLLGDSVDYDPATNTYTENFNGGHSPIVGWLADGHPIYGPYGYDDPDDPSSAVRRMISGYQKRDGSNGSTNLNSTGRTTLPQWANRLEGRNTTLNTNEYGPGISATYILGHYLEDYAYKGDLGLVHGVDFDLDEYNGRFCKTPEFPDGVWAYFTTIEADGTPAFPYNIGRNFYGTPSGGAVNSVTETVTNTFLGGPNKQHAAEQIVAAGGVVTLTWSVVEGGIYQIETSPDLVNWDDSTPTFTASSIAEIADDSDSLDTEDRYFYKITRTGITSFDTTGYSDAFGDGGGGNGGGGGDTFVATFTGPPLPPANAIEAVTLGGVAVTDYTRDSNTQITVNSVPAGVPVGSHALTVTFTPPGGSPLVLTSSNSYTVE